MMKMPRIRARRVRGTNSFEFRVSSFEFFGRRDWRRPREPRATRAGFS